MDYRLGHSVHEGHGEEDYERLHQQPVREKHLQECLPRKTEKPTFKEGIVMEESFGLDRNHIKTGGKASPQPTKDKRPGSAISVDGADIIRSQVSRLEEIISLADHRVLFHGWSRPLSVPFLICTSGISQPSRLGYRHPQLDFYRFFKSPHLLWEKDEYQEVLETRWRIHYSR